MLDRDHDRRLIGDSARTLLERSGGLGRARRIRDAGLMLDRTTWNEMATLGWFAMLLPEADGGSDFEMFDILELLHALGECLAPEPVVATLACAHALSHACTPDGHAMRQAVASGQTIALFVPALTMHGDAASPVGERLSGCTGRRTDLHLGDTFLLSGDVGGVPALVALPKTHPGLSIAAARTVDGGTSGHLRLDNVEIASLPLLARGAAAEAARRDAVDIERVCNAAVLVGLMERTLALTTDYLKTRMQFGVPIGSLQALQHDAASMHVDVASSRAIVREAARSVGHVGQTKAAAAAKAYASNMALRITRAAIQLHGAIGFTDEYDLGLFHRRAIALVAADGGTAAAMALWTDEDRKVQANELRSQRLDSSGLNISRED